MVELRERWKAFGSIVFDPWVLLLLAAVVGLGYVLVNYIDPVMVVTLTTVIALVSGVLGGIIANKWSNATEEKVIAARGKSAVRGLKLLLQGIAALEQRAAEYLSRHEKDVDRTELTPEVIKTYLEEIILECRGLSEETLSSVENWTDIVPEADIKTQIGLVSAQQRQIVSLKEERLDLVVEKTKMAEVSQAEKEKFELRLKENEERSYEARKELEQKLFKMEQNWGNLSLSRDVDKNLSSIQGRIDKVMRGIVTKVDKDTGTITVSQSPLSSEPSSENDSDD